MLKEARRKLGKTQAQVATEIGLKGGLYVSQMESGRRSIPEHRIKSFAKAYELSVEQLKKMWVKRTPYKWQPKTTDDTDVLPTIKAIAKCDIAQLTLSEFSRLLRSASQLQKCTPGLIKEILTCGFK